MTTTDSNGLIQYQTTDNVVPLQTAFNGLSSSVSTALNSTVRTFKVANDTERNALATTRPPTASNPLVVFNSASGKRYHEINTGSGWSRLIPETPIIANTPLFGSSPTSPFFIQAGVAEGEKSTLNTGDTNIKYPTPFPNGVLSANLTPYDFAVGDRVAILNTIQSKTQLNFRIFQTNGAPLLGSVCKWSYTVIGW